MTARTGAILCGALLLLFAVLSHAAVLTKSPTVDEPVQMVAGWLRLHRGDYRLDIEDPPLWELWASLPNGADALRPDFSAPSWETLRSRPDFSAFFATHSLFNTAGVDGDAVINRSRAMMLVLGVFLGVLIAVWARQLAGPAAAVISTFLFALDPNFLGHAPLVKNDVASALAFTAAAWIVWLIGRRVTVPRVLALAGVCGAAVTIKFSCVLLAPIVALLLAARAVSWPAGRRWWTVLAIGVVVTVAAWAIIWATYGFRFAATPDGPLDGGSIIEHLRRHQLGGMRGALAAVRPGDLAAWRPDHLTRAVLWARSHHLLPEAWLDGFLLTYSTTLARESFLLGARSDIGFWYYFPVAILVKTPLATLSAVVCAAIVGLLGLRHRRHWWTLACLIVPPAIYLASAMHSHMDIGLRHVLPLYPFAFIGCGVAAAQALRRWVRPARLLLAGLGIALAAETLAAAPNFIAFFNTAAGGAPGGLRLLSDSNLDWGQDLKLLAAWQRSHPDVNLYLSYFGLADPAFYGIRYHSLPGNYAFGPLPVREQIQDPAVFAISASHLQGISMGVDVSDLYANLRTRRPREILGGTIYLYDMSNP